MPSPETPFAEGLSDVREGHRFVETFGLGPPLLAVALAAAAAYFLVVPRSSPLDAAEMGVLALLVAGALACAGYEIHRRRRRASLVAVDQQIGVYRGGQLEGVLSARDLGALRAHEPASLKGLLGMLITAVAFLGYGLTEEGGPAARAVALGPGVWLLLLTVSFARGAFLCATFHLPGSRAKALVSRLALGRAGVRWDE
jgi:hypothetical protein